jgi:hypothetical protein
MKAETRKGEVFAWFSFRSKPLGKGRTVVNHTFLPAKIFFVDLQADLNRQGEECSGISTSNVGYFGAA